MRHLSLVLALVPALPVAADVGSIASLTEIRGNVLVSRNSSLASATEPIRLTAGTRILTTANGTAVIQYDEGCRVELKEYQRIEIGEVEACTAQTTLAWGDWRAGASQADGERAP